MDFAVVLRAQKVGKPSVDNYVGKIKGAYTTNERELQNHSRLEIIEVGAALHSRLMHMIMEGDFENVDEIREYLHEIRSSKSEKPIGPIPVFERQTSVCTNQGGEPTCYAHSTAKIILQNIYLFVNPIHVQDKEKFQSCFDVLKTDIEHEYTHLSIEKCGIGYFKILLFLYAYFISKQNKNGLLRNTVSRSLEMPDIEQFKGRIQTNFDALRKRIQHKIESRGLIWTEFKIQCISSTLPFLKDMIIHTLQLGFYIYVFVEHPTFPIGHAVVLVNHRNENGQDYFAISNSWGNQVDITSNLTKITLGSKVCYVKEFIFLLPFCTTTTPLPQPLTIYSLIEWIPHYVRDIQEFKSRSGGKTKRRKKRSCKKIETRFTV
jgi:hypothetical protein